MNEYDVVIIGSGWAGICTMKHCLEENLTGIILEKTDDYGGVWNIKNTPSVYANTYSVSSKLYLSMSDFPIPESYPEFPHHTLVMEYLRMYTKNFDIEKYISLNSEVVNIEKKNNKWYTIYNTKSGSNIIISKNIALCTGHNSICLNNPEIDTSNFKGQIIHASKYDDNFKNQCLNKRVLIYGMQ
jgi:dimethylaniline monooxygenase (N-oxide forming)